MYFLCSALSSFITIFSFVVAFLYHFSLLLLFHYVYHLSVHRLCSLYNRAVTNCGLEFRSDKLWLSFIEWEKSNSSSVTTPSSPNTTSTTTASTPPTPTAGRLQHVLAIYDQLLATPTQQHQQHFERYEKLMAGCFVDKAFFDQKFASDTIKCMHNFNDHLFDVCLFEFLC